LILYIDFLLQISRLILGILVLYLHTRKSMRNSKKEIASLKNNKKSNKFKSKNLKQWLTLRNLIEVSTIKPLK